MLACGGGNEHLRALGRLDGAGCDKNLPHAATDFLHDNDVDNEHDINNDYDHAGSDHYHSFDVNDHPSPR